MLAWSGLFRPHQTKFWGNTWYKPSTKLPLGNYIFYDSICHTDSILLDNTIEVLSNPISFLMLLLYPWRWVYVLAVVGVVDNFERVFLVIIKLCPKATNKQHSINNIIYKFYCHLNKFTAGVIQFSTTLVALI